ncbi:methyltransferase domain-containing protein [Helicobacter saguini]|uniref:Class I SAM-dependent methyltransferase n=2 Tax=Helicobacter saguini TaxID=1548018 RepID=A0A347VUE2_9HELI|nr:methyltransferase domain-containing protein [Helicobacter saguini]MWV67182.1 methyltransferase domain-containing protein [Helicobacter saguini]MWV69534.1 methyltransferase domain-containing protein [Helicobacter saguini]MWV70915.1 methyltransferase domain-containing protein [Helicobacter saguini]TLD92554.1 class I SAM-dependent methyltransferase [Helicobacter saguini]
MVEIRRKEVLKFLQQYKAKNVLEIGCGLHSLFNFYEDFENFVVVEPSSEFAKKALQDSKNLQNTESKITIINDFIENHIQTLQNTHFDFIILSSLLHEVINPKDFLSKILKVMKNETILHINVPNANSFHLLWAYKSGLIKKLGNLTERAKSLQQNTTFTLESLQNMLLESAKICENIESKIKILQSGSYFIKPFNHAKMQECLKLNIIDSNLLSGLEKMIEYMPNLGAEIYINATLK